MSQNQNHQNNHSNSIDGNGPIGKGRHLVVNYVPGEECRVAVVVDGKLEEFYSERNDAVSHVGNIYVGRVTNVEPSIQAAFVDFGLDAAGFLHTSDLHPRYFAGDDGETTERVGKKTPRHDRPPIQDCLRRGQEIVVQVLKEGVGSKGPTLTSYLSIPGRYLVMMPQMDKVGVSRKVEDEELRAKMKAILDQLELPEGFGFILRTAGLDRTKTELKRDLAYLMRLQKDMERRRKGGSKPRLLYSESDLLVRTLRDMLTTDTESVVIDSEAGIKRAAAFIRIVSPRSATVLKHYAGRTPVFHALGVQPQVQTMYSREVPLPSGGRLVIDETEALVAIDVNSGRSRDSSDSETNAYNTNMEAIDEISRQLRLRDLGGIVINDLIDMRAAKHRREVETRFEEIMKRDRARSTLLPVSEFGIVEMTRQRMRGSHESIHFHSCPHCHGRGLIQRPESIAADALRELAAILDHDKVSRAEMVIHPRVAGELLSSKRRALSRLERTFDKPVAVRLSDAVNETRVTFYAYDAQGNDIEVERLARFRPDDETLKSYDDPALKAAIESEDDTDTAWADAPPPPPEVDPDEAAELAALETAPHLIEQDAANAPGEDSGPNFLQGERGSPGSSGRGKRGRRRRGRGGGGGGGGGGQQQQQGGGGQRQPPQHVPHAPQGAPPHAQDGAPALDGQQGGGPAVDGQQQGAPGTPGEGGRRKRRRRRGRGGRGGGGGDAMATGAPAIGVPPPIPQSHGGPGHGGHGHHGHGHTPKQGDGDAGPSLADRFRAESGSGSGGPMMMDEPRGDRATQAESAGGDAADTGHEPGQQGGGLDHDGAPGAGGAPGEGGQRRGRRRRGRRGRGGGGGGGGGGGASSGGQQGPQGQSSQGGHGGPPPARPQHHNQPPPIPQAPRPQSAPPAPAPPPVAAPKPRLYAAFRRLRPGSVPTKRDE